MMVKSGLGFYCENSTIKEGFIFITEFVIVVRNLPIYVLKEKNSRMEEFQNKYFYTYYFSP